MANSNTEHSKELRKKSAIKWNEQNKSKAQMNRAMSSGRYFIKNATLNDIDRLEELRDKAQARIEELENLENK